MTTRPPAYAPRLMRLPEAARYVALSETKFIELVKAGRIAQGIRSKDRGRTTSWDVIDLDSYVDSLRDAVAADDDWSGAAA